MQKQQKIFFCFYFRFPTVLPVALQPPCRGCTSAAARNSIHIIVILKISCAAAPKLPQLKSHIYCVYFICAVSVGAGSRAHRVWISAYIGQFYRRAIFVLFCIFPCPLSPARLQGRSLCEHTANSGAKVWYTARFCAILDKKSTQPGRARHKRGHT